MRRVARIASLLSFSFAFAFAFASSTALAEEGTTSASEPTTERAEAGESRPGVVNETAAVPRASSGYVSTSGGAIGGGRLAFDGSAIVSPFRRIAIGAGADVATGAAASPWGGAYAQILEQASAGIDMTTAVRVRAVAPEGAGSEVAARLLVGRAFGPTYLALNGGIARSIGTRQDVDWDAGAMFYGRIARILRVGAEGRARGEAVETYVTAEDAGRPIEALAGATAGVDVDRVLFQTLAGFSWPRGTLAAGPAVLGSATVTF